MATGFPVKANYATGDVLTAANMNDLAGTLNYLDPTAKGDLFPASDGSTLTRLAIGTNGQVLTADSTATTGMKWAAVSGGGMTLLSTTSLSTATTTVSSISGDYTDLVISVENVVSNTAAKKLAFRFNGITAASSYYGHFTYGGGGTTSGAFATSSSTGTGLSWSANGKIILPNESLTLDGAGYSFRIPNYTITTAPKLIQFIGGSRNTGDTYNGVAMLIGTTAAISSFTVLSDDGTTTMTGTIKVYGVK